MDGRDIILKTSDLTKRYGAVEAVSGVDMTVRRGDIYGFVGLNGSGKTTLIRLVTGLIRKTRGSFTLFGGEADEKTNKRISSMVETPSLYMNLDAVTNLKIQCDFCCVKDDLLPRRLLELVGLENTGRKRVKDFSLGMRQRLGIAVCLVGTPELLILDEPTNGLDPEGIIEIRELLLRLNREAGMTVLISSHILSELSKLATTYGFIHRGKLIRETTSAELFSNVESKIVTEVDNLQGAAEALNGRAAYDIVNGKIEIKADIPLSDLVTFMQQYNVKVLNANKVSQDLESYFMNLISGHNTVGGQRR